MMVSHSGASSAEGHAIRTELLRKEFGDFVAVTGVTFDVPYGQNFGLLGPNGAGKSTLIRMLTTLMLPTSGRAFVAGYDLRRAPDAVRRSIGVIPQALTSDPDLTAEENLDFFARLYSVRKGARRKTVAELLAAVDLVKWRHKLVRTFSGGMRRRLEVARALMHRPRILFLDEPTTGLDPVSRLHMWEMLQKLKMHADVTLFLTTHYMEEADQLCDQLAIVDHGTIVAQGTPTELKARVERAVSIEVECSPVPAQWFEKLQTLPGVISAKSGRGSYQIDSADQGATVAALIEAAHRFGVVIRSLIVKGHTLEDVFIQYTGRDLRDSIDEKARTPRGSLGPQA